jgi:Bacterial type II and III secretion system protein
MKTHHSILSITLPPATALILGWLAVPPAHSREMSGPQIEIEAKFVEVSQKNLKELGFDLFLEYYSSISQQVIQPGGVSPQALGTFTVNPPSNLPKTGDIEMCISPKLLEMAGLATHQVLGSPRVTTKSAQRAVTDVLRDLKLTVTPRLSSDRTGIEMNLLPEVPEFTRWSVDAFGTVAFGQVGGSERITRDVKITETRTVDRPVTVLVPFDNGFQIVNREETRLVPTQETTTRTEQVTERQSINRLGDVAGGGGLRVNYMFNPYVGLNVRGEVIGGRDTLGLVTGSVFGEIPTNWPVTPTWSLGGGVLFPCAEPVMDVGLGLKKRVTPDFDVFSEVHLITDFGRTTFGEFNVGASFPLGRKVPTGAEVSSGETVVLSGTSTRSARAPELGRIPVIAHVFRKRGGSQEKRDLLIFVTPQMITPAE